MKLNEKINLIRNELNDEIQPINTKDILANAHITSKIESPIKNKISNFRMHFTLVTLLFLTILIPIIYLNNENINDFDDADDLPTYDTNDEVYGFIATSAISLIYSSNDVFSNNDSDTNNNLLVVENLNSLNNMLSSVDIMLSYDNNQIYRLASDKSAYTNKLIYEGIGLLGEDLYYEIYFNESLINNTNTTIDLLVVIKDTTIKLYGKKEIVNNSTYLKMTYYSNEENHKDYLQVSKNLNGNEDSYEYVIVKDDIIIEKNKLTLFQDESPYVILDNSLQQNNLSSFKISTSVTNKFSIEYAVNSPLGDSPISEDSSEQEPINNESGSITVDVDNNSSSFYVYSNSYSEFVVIDNSK